MSTPAASTKSVNSTSQDAPAEHQNGGAGAEHQQQNGDNSAEKQGQESSAEPDGGYPPQRHAGAVGYGPEYASMREATLTDKVVGMKDEIKGKLTHNPEEVQHGREQRSGELKRRKLEEDGDPTDQRGKTSSDTEESGDKESADSSSDQPGTGNAATTTVTDKREPGTHPTEKGAEEEAATTAPEGTEEAERQRRGENTYADKQIDERQNTDTSA